MKPSSFFGLLGRDRPGKKRAGRAGEAGRRVNGHSRSNARRLTCPCNVTRRVPPMSSIVSALKPCGESLKEIRLQNACGALAACPFSSSLSPAGVVDMVQGPSPPGLRRWGRRPAPLHYVKSRRTRRRLSTDRGQQAAPPCRSSAACRPLAPTLCQAREWFDLTTLCQAIGGFL